LQPAQARPGAQQCWNTRSTSVPVPNCTSRLQNPDLIGSTTTIAKRFHSQKAISQLSTPGVEREPETIQSMERLQQNTPLKRVDASEGSNLFEIESHFRFSWRSRTTPVPKCRQAHAPLLASEFQWLAPIGIIRGVRGSDRAWRRRDSRPSFAYGRRVDRARRKRGRAQ
jgi:hypothetical protein